MIIYHCVFFFSILHRTFHFTICLTFSVRNSRTIHLYSKWWSSFLLLSAFVVHFIFPKKGGFSSFFCSYLREMDCFFFCYNFNVFMKSLQNIRLNIIWHKAFYSQLPLKWTLDLSEILVLYKVWTTANWICFKMLSKACFRKEWLGCRIVKVSTVQATHMQFSHADTFTKYSNL